MNFYMMLYDNSLIIFPKTRSGKCKSGVEGGGLLSVELKNGLLYFIEVNLR